MSLARPLALVAGILVAVTGCAAAPTSQPVTANPATYLRQVHDRLEFGRSYDAAGDETLLDLGQSACRSLRSGVTLIQVRDTIEAGGISPDDTTVILNAATTHLCPEQR